MRGYTAKHFLLALFCSPPIKQVECEKRGLEILYRSLRSSYGLLISNKVNDYFSSRLLRNFWLQNWTKSTSSCQFRPLHNSGIIPLTLKPIQANSPYLKLPLAQLSAFPKSFSLFPNAVYSLQLEIWFGCSSLPPGLLAWLKAGARTTRLTQSPALSLAWQKVFLDSSWLLGPSKHLLIGFMSRSAFPSKLTQLLQLEPHPSPNGLPGPPGNPRPESEASDLFRFSPQLDPL